MIHMKEDFDSELMYAEEDFGGIDIMALVRKLLDNWKRLFRWAGIGFVIGLAVVLTTPKEYTSSSKMAPEIVTSGRSGSLSSLASLAGVNLSSSSSPDAVSPTLYPDVVSSTQFLVELSEIPVSFKVKDEKIETTLYDYWKNYTKATLWKKVVKFPIKMLAKLSGSKPSDEAGTPGAKSKRLSYEQTKVLGAISSHISVSIDKKTFIIKVSASAQDPGIAQTLAEAVCDKLQKYVTDYRTEKARHDLEYYEQLYSDAKDEYYAAQQNYARYIDANQGVILHRVRIEQERLQNEMNLKYQLYNQMAQQVQVSKAQVQKETPVVAVIQEPLFPYTKSKPSTIKTVFIFTFLAGCCAAAWVLFADVVKSIFKKEDSEEQSA